MLSDQKIQAIASDYVHERMPSCMVLRCFELDDPPGVYWRPSDILYMAPTSEPCWGEAATREMMEWKQGGDSTVGGARDQEKDGFFIYRETGDTRVISRGATGRARFAIDWGNVPDYQEAEIKPEHIRYILTGAIHPNSHDPSPGSPRLTDYELYVIAEKYIGSETPLGQHQPDALCELEDPPGVLFVPLDTGEFPTVSDEQLAEWDHFGFFVHRTSGEVWPITNSEIEAAGGRVPLSSSDDIRRILTIVLAGTDPRRPWWKFWG